jgi:WD40 repeat protein
MIARSLIGALWALVLTAATLAQAPEPPGGGAPLLRVEAGGPTAFVSSLAFSPDGTTLYAAGFDKVVRVWTLDPKRGFVPSSTSFRVPIGAGPDGVINAVAVSADGRWLAAAGQGAKRDAGGFREAGWLAPRTGLTTEMRLDEGNIYVFNTRTGAVRTLRGNRGPVLSLAFEPTAGAGGSFLASCAREQDEPGTTFAATVRLWDLSRADGKEAVAALPSLPDPVHVGKTPAESRVTRPGLAVYPGGSLVGVACEDGRFRLWDVGANRIHDAKADGVFNTAVVYRPDEGRFLSTSLRGSLGHLQTWYLSEDSRPWPHPDRQLDLGHEEVPRALTLFSAGADGRPGHAAVVLRAPRRDNRFSLRVIDLSTFRPTGEAVNLWKGTGNEPVVAAAPGGQHLAVAGNDDNTILVYAIKDLLAGKAAPQTLRSDGATLRYAGFVTQGKDRPGLLVNEAATPADGPCRPREPAAGDLVFDLGGRTLTTELKGWKIDAPDLQGWDVHTQVGRTQVLRVTQNRRPVGQVVELRPGQEVTAYALLPAAPAPLRTPLLAVAVIEAGEVALRLYDVMTGQQVRQCTGPVSGIRWVAFSGDGRLVAAAADDQTTCLWSLTSLAEIVGKHGSPRGLLVIDDGAGRAVLAEPAEGLRAGEVVDGLVAEGKLRRTASARDFYRAVWEIAPARQKTMTVRVAGRDVETAVGQGVDERKPLLSLFVTAEDRKTRRREWIGWSPVGPYDSSGREAERLVGWHVNTGETVRPPVRFALADQFRKDNYKPGILKKLADYGNPGQAIDAWRPEGDGPPPDPTMTLGLTEAGITVPQDRPRHFRVGQRALTLTLGLDDFPAEKVAAVEWQAQGEKGRMAPSGEGKWSADLSHLAWKRGEQAVTVHLRTVAPHTREYAGELMVRYQPPAPRLEELRQHAAATDRDPYPVALRVTPAPGQAARITIRQKGKPEALSEERNVREPRTVQKEVGLVAGENLIQVVAENEDAPPGADGDGERARLDLPVIYKVPRPQIALRQIVLPDGSARRIDPDHPDTPLIVEVPTFRVEGEIAALAPLVSAEWATGDNKAEPLAGFDGAKEPRRLAVSQTVTLREPGPQRLRFIARVAKDDRQEARSFTVEYRPALPRATIAAPDNGVNLYEGEDAARVGVEVALRWPADPHACKAQLVVNGKEQGAPAAVAAGAKSFRGEAPLQPGENRIEVRLSNDWQIQPAGAGPAVVWYRRPPRIIKLEAGKPSDRPPRVEIVARVESPEGTPLERAELSAQSERADGLRVTGDAVRRVVVPVAAMTSEKGDGVRVWTMRSSVPLDEGQNTIRLVAFNKDGECRKAATTTVKYTKPPPPRPEAHFFAPRDDTTVESAEYEVEFVVRSESPLTKVELRRGGEEVVFSAPAGELQQAGPGAQGVRYGAKRRVTLRRGANLLSIVAANADGGEISTPPVTINYHYRPVVTVAINGLETGGTSLRALREPAAGSALPFAPVATGRVTLVGQVSWDREHDAALAGLRHLDVCVNGYHQPPAFLEPARAGERRRTFRLELLLSQPENTIEVLPPPSDPPIAVAAGSRRRCEVPCTAPVKVRRQLLHLLVIDLDEDATRAAQSALAAIQGRDLSGTSFAVPYCSDGGRLYGPLAGDDVTREAVNGQLDVMQRTLQMRAAEGAVNDLVMIYYRGGILSKDGVQFFHSSLSRRAARPRATTLIPCDRLARFFGDSPGAQIVFLNVTAGRDGRDGSPDVVANRTEPYVAILRYTWSGPPDRQPARALIVSSLQTAMANAKAFGEVRDTLAQEFDRQLGDKPPWPSKVFPETWFDDWMPPGLRSLPLGTPRAR